jgi:hypothetical protein
MARRGLRFTVSLGAKSSSNCRILLVEVDTSRAAVSAAAQRLHACLQLVLSALNTAAHP